jgi:hypothetical protein
VGGCAWRVKGECVCGVCVHVCVCVSCVPKPQEPPTLMEGNHEIAPNPGSVYPPGSLATAPNPRAPNPISESKTNRQR